jgi:DNA mismatch repair protein MutS
VPGATDRSYGIHVARLAGVPEKVIERANEILKELERENVLAEGEDSENGKKKRSKASARYTQMMLFDSGKGRGNSVQSDSTPEPLETALRELNVDKMTPIEALNKLHELKRLLDQVE